MADATVGSQVDLQIMDLEIQQDQQRLNIRQYEYRKATLAAEMAQVEQNIEAAHEQIAKLDEQAATLRKSASK